MQNLYKQRQVLLLLTFLLSLLSASCNIFSTSDTPATPIDRYLDALAKANSGDCENAERILREISDPTDDMKVALGWAQICLGGIKSGDIAKSIYNYSSSTNNMTVVGALAKTMLPYNEAKAAYFSGALNTFSLVNDPLQKNIQMGIVHFIKAASILSQQATTSSSSDLEKDDIGPTVGCDAVDCVAGSAGCTAGMSDTSVTDFITQISSAATALSVAGATDLKTLADTLTSGLGAGGTQGRCYIYQNTVP